MPPASSPQVGAPFKMELSSRDGIHKGWMGILRQGIAWPAVCVANREDAVVIEEREGRLYILSGTNYCLAPSFHGYVGFYDQPNGTPWTLSPDGRFHSDYTGCDLAFGQHQLMAIDPDPNASLIVRKEPA